MRYGLLALAVLGFVAFSAAPSLAECVDGHKKMTEIPTTSTVAQTEQSKPKSGS